MWFSVARTISVGLALLSGCASNLVASESNDAFAIYGKYVAYGANFRLFEMLSVRPPANRFNFDDLEAAYKSLDKQQKCYLGIMMLASSKFDGEYSFRFRLLIKPEASSITSLLHAATPTSVAEFCGGLRVPVTNFRANAEDYLNSNFPNFQSQVSEE